MKLTIRALPQCDREEMRTLLIDAADELAGANSRLLQAELPWEGGPILLMNSRKHPVLVSFDLNNSQAALLNGLQASDRLAVDLPWINQTYPDLERQRETPQLVVVSAEPPAGSKAILADNPGLTLFTCKVLRIGDETGILLETANQDRTHVGAAQPSVAAKAGDACTVTLQKTAEAENMPPLSEEERAYFQQL